MKTNNEIINSLFEDGFDLDQIIDFLEDGEALLQLGYTDQIEIEDAHDEALKLRR